MWIHDVARLQREQVWNSYRIDNSGGKLPLHIDYIILRLCWAISQLFTTRVCVMLIPLLGLAAKKVPIMCEGFMSLALNNSSRFKSFVALPNTVNTRAIIESCMINVVKSNSFLVQDGCSTFLRTVWLFAP